MNQREAVIEALKMSGGYATLGQLYQTAPIIKGVEWKTKTPFASIRRIVQKNPNDFFKIRPGLWALKEMRHQIPAHVLAESKEPKKEEYTHTYYQGLLVEIGNLTSHTTYVPNQDKNRKYLNKTLCEITTISAIYPFTYDHLVRRAQSIDVIWFNNRKMPHVLFEVEHSTDSKNSLLKFIELQDFNVEFKIVADELRHEEFIDKLSFDAFRPIAERVKFLSYNAVSGRHSKEYELQLAKRAW